MAARVEAQAGASGSRDGADIQDQQLNAIQHRVRNHLSMIVGMIRLQSRGSEAPDEFATRSRTGSSRSSFSTRR